MNETGTIQLHHLKILGEFALNEATLLKNRYFCSPLSVMNVREGFNSIRKVPE